jgi:single-stranded-DNA-specific exonuclease
MMHKRWTILQADPEKVNSLQESLKIHPAICKILVQRNIETFEQAKSFYRPAVTDLHDPWLRTTWIRRLKEYSSHRKRKKYSYLEIMMLDGTTAVASYVSVLAQASYTTGFLYTHRYREGYGVSKQELILQRQCFSVIISLTVVLISGFDLIC